MTGSVFSDTLHSITTTKLDELSKKKTIFDQQYTNVKQALTSQDDALKRLDILIEGVKTCFGVKTGKAKGDHGSRGTDVIILGSTNNPRLEMDLKNINRFIEQARFDPSMSRGRLLEWEKTLSHYLELQSVKYQYATLFGQLVTEWLSSEKKDKTPSDTDVDMTEAYEEVPAAEKLESRTNWERSVFKPFQIDDAALQAYLNALFGKGNEDKKDVFKALKKVRSDVEAFENVLAQNLQFNEGVLHWVIDSLVAGGLMNDEKRAVLKDFKQNSTILREIADVLNMRMNALDSWTWGEHVAVEEHRQISGAYNIQLDEDLLQAIFLQYIGARWSVFFRKALVTFRKTGGAWNKLGHSITGQERKRLEYYLGSTSFDQSLQLERAKIYRKNYFLSKLPLSEHQATIDEEGEEEAELRGLKRKKGGRMKQTARMSSQMMQQQQQQAIRPRMQMASKAARRSAPASAQLNPYAPAEDDFEEEEDEDEDEEWEDPSEPKRPMELKHTLLHLLSTDIAMFTRLYGDVTCFRSAFESWNPSLPHATILRVMSFFGVSDKWLKFFKTFLEAPLQFKDDPNAAPRIRKRGTPGAHSLSDIFGETVLFCLDFSINQSTDGALLYRMAEDFWFWSPDHAKCVKAWGAVNEFAKVMGVELDEKKSGTVRTGDRSTKALDINPALPDGDIRWGFLYLDPNSGRFEVDEDMIESHTKELQNQLRDKSKSVFAWIQAWNIYATTFFNTNFGKPANCFGRDHVDMMLATHEQVHRAIFPDTTVVDYLKKTLRERFGVDNIPDGFLFFPVELGGLDLKSPFINPLQIRDSVLRKPTDLLDEWQEAEAEAYRHAKARFEKGETRDNRYELDDPDWEPAEGKDAFMSFKEFTKYREDMKYKYSNQLMDVYKKLLVRPTQESIILSSKVLDGLSTVGHNGGGIHASHPVMEPYWKWVAQLYGPEMLDRFGGFNIVDPGLLPIGMVSLFKGNRVNWQG